MFSAQNNSLAGPPRNSSDTMLGLLLAVLAVATITLALFSMAALQPRLDESSPTATARVVDVDPGHNGAAASWIEVEYTQPKGKITARTSHFRSEDLQIGREVEIRYDPAEPDRVAVAGAAEDWVSRWTYVILSGVAELALLVLVIRQFWRRRRIT